jgi:hypothetical protein
MKKEKSLLNAVVSNLARKNPGFSNFSILFFQLLFGNFHHPAYAYEDEVFAISLDRCRQFGLKIYHQAMTFVNKGRKTGGGEGYQNYFLGLL